MTHEEQHKPTRYVCMQFIHRSDNIVQIKVSRYSSRRSLDLCDERGMALDHWPIVQMVQTPDQNIPCPFVGGYNVHMYFPNNTMVCGDMMLLLRIESECEKGEGILFDFRNEECIPPGLPRVTRQRAFCVAHWTEGTQNFVILQHETVHKHIWCLRITDALGDMQGAYLMLNLVCDPNDPIQETHNYYYFQMFKSIHSSTCADEIEECSDLTQFCTTMSMYRRHCAKTCGDCEYESELGLCTFQEHVRGNWIDSSQKGDKNVTIYDYSLLIQDLGRFQCLEVQSEKHKERKVLLELFEDGCYPRYACLELEKISPSVMKYRLSNRLDWPLPHLDDQKEHICHDRNFKDSKDRTYRKELGPPKLLVNSNNIHSVKCGLPDHLHYGVPFREKEAGCGGCLYYNPNNGGDRLVVQPVNCSTPSLPIEYLCLASFDLNDTWAVVTKREHEQNICWVFTKRGKILVLKAAQCLQFEKFDTADLEAVFTTVKSTTPEFNYCRNLVLVAQTTTTVRTTPPRTTAAPDRIHYTIMQPIETELEVESPNEQVITPKSSRVSGSMSGSSGSAAELHSVVSLTLLVLYSSWL